ncbi:MAG: AsmA family protein [Pseudomonadota bacterium]
MPRATSHFSLRRLWFLPPVLLILLLVLLWDWNWFKPLIEKQASNAVGRSVRIDDLDVQLAWHPDITLSGITLANPADFQAETPALATVERVAVRFGIRDLFEHRVRISRLEIEQPIATLLTGPKGVRNWQLTLPPRDPDAKPWDVQIAGLVIREGRFSMVDAALQADIKGGISTMESSQDGEALILADASGRYRGEPLKAGFKGGSLLSLRSPENPYPVDLMVESGSTRVSLKGSLLDPLQFAGAKLRLILQGPNLSALADFTQLPLPNTPPYKLEGDLDYQAGRILFRDFKGLMGESDLAGDVSVRLQKPRPLMEATVHSTQVRLADLGGLIGGDPNAPAADAPGGDGRLIPSTPINLPRLQAADVKLDFKGDRIIGDKLPFDRLAFKLGIDDGILRVSPADFGIGDGALRFYATLDPRDTQFGLEATAELRRVDISRLMQKTGYQGSGRIGGTVALKGKGRSAAELLGSGNGELKLAMAGGDFSALLLDLSGLDFGNALLSAIGISPRTEVRCLVGDFALVNGQLDTKSFVLDTGNTNLLLDGGANLKDETLALRLRTQPKRANIARLKAPIHIRGTFADPRVRPDFVELGARTGAAIALGVLLTPLAAILPTLQLGPGEDRDCKALLAEAETSAPPQPAAR